jgi:hypothetical protein
MQYTKLHGVKVQHCFPSDGLTGSLPTIYHWNRAAGPFSAATIVPASNFGGAGVLPVGSKPDMSPWGNRTESLWSDLCKIVFMLNFNLAHVVHH